MINGEQAQTALSVLVQYAEEHGGLAMLGASCGNPACKTQHGAAIITSNPDMAKVILSVFEATGLFGRAPLDIRQRTSPEGSAIPDIRRSEATQGNAEQVLLAYMTGEGR